MDIPLEIYIELYLIANDLIVTKILRSLCKTSLKECDYYHKILLNTNKILYFDEFDWYILDDEEKIQEKINNSHIRDRYARLLIGDNNFEEKSDFKIKIKDLFNKNGC